MAPVVPRVILNFALCLGILLGCIFPHAVHEILLCRSCGYHVVNSNEVINVSSILSLRQKVGRFVGVEGVLLQRFRNSYGIEYDVVTVSEANATKTGEPEEKDSWFPGFRWTIIICPQCGHHLGWFFDTLASNKTFFGLILDHLVHQSYADSILTLPNSQPFPVQTI